MIMLKQKFIRNHIQTTEVILIMLDLSYSLAHSQMTFFSHIIITIDKNDVPVTDTIELICLDKQTLIFQIF